MPTATEKIKSCTAFITYTPLKDEIDPFTAPLSFHSVSKYITISQDPMTNPDAVAQHIMNRFDHDKVCILIPGQLFDIFGSRKGRGGGWYDRFLSKINSEWIRIGITERAHFRVKKIDCNPWDERMDAVYVYNVHNNTWEEYFVTNSRF